MAMVRGQRTAGAFAFLGPKRCRRPRLAQVKESNARIVQWSDGSQALQVGAEFFDINVTASTSARAEPVKPEEPSTASTSDLRPVAGLTLLVAAHPGSYMLEAHSAVNGLMTLVPYSASSTAHRRLANTLSDKHAKVTRTRSVVLEEDPEVQRAKREKAEADKAKAARKERAKASGGGTRRRRGLGRSMAIDRSDDEEDMDEGDSGDERGASTTRTSGRSGRRSYLDGPDEDDEGFVVESEGEDGAQPDVGGADDLDDLDAAAEQAKKRKAAAKAKRPLTGSDRDAEGEVRSSFFDIGLSRHARRWKSIRLNPQPSRHSLGNDWSWATTMTMIESRRNLYILAALCIKRVVRR